MSKPWTSPNDLRGQTQKLWDRGDLLRHLVTGEPAFPIRLRLKGPSSAEITDYFAAVCDWARKLREMPQVRIEWRDVTHRVHGANTLPQKMWLDSAEQAFALIGRSREADQFRQLLELVRERQPILLSWLARRPLRALELAEDFERMLDFVEWMQKHPRPDIYLRQIDLPGVHTKFIESHRSVLTEWLDPVLPADVINETRTGASRFAARYGFLEKPIRIRFRILDSMLELSSGWGTADITLDAATFACLERPTHTVFITENETNFLAFPPHPGSLVIFGSGYGWEALAQAHWLNDCEIHYWGDIDTHGFAILDQLRGYFSHTRSLLMDRETLLAHEAFWGQEDSPIHHELSKLTAAEHALYEDLRKGTYQAGLRLEQERIGFGYVETALQRISN